MNAPTRFCGALQADKKKGEPALWRGLPVCLKLLKQRGREVTLGGVGQNGDYALALAQLFGQLDGGGHVGAAGDAAHDALKGCQTLRGLNGLSVTDDADAVVDLLI